MSEECQLDNRYSENNYTYFKISMKSGNYKIFYIVFITIVVLTYIRYKKRAKILFYEIILLWFTSDILTTVTPLNTKTSTVSSKWTSKIHLCTEIYGM